LYLIALFHLTDKSYLNYYMAGEI